MLKNFKFLLLLTAFVIISVILSNYLYLENDFSISAINQELIEQVLDLKNKKEKWKTREALGEFILCPNEQSIKLTPYFSVAQEKPEGSNKMFFFETSGRPTLSPRQACAVESAARFTNLTEIMVLLKSPSLLIGGEDNEAMCGLYRGQFQSRISFHSLDIDKEFEDTPLDDFMKRGQFEKSKYPSTHMSDMIRVVFLYKYGGWYADVDYIFMRSLNENRNVKKNPNPAFLRPNFIALNGFKRQTSNYRATNSIMKFSEPKNPFLNYYLQKINETFRGRKRTELGPTNMAKWLKQFCDLWPHFQLKKLGEGRMKNCSNIDTVLPRVFNPIRIAEFKSLFRPKPYPDGVHGWQKLFGKSLAVHFYSSSSNRKNVTGDEQREAYAYLAPKYCPYSYFLPETFSAGYIH